MLNRKVFKLIIFFSPVMNYLKRALQGTVVSVKNHKALFVILLILQTIFILSSAALGTYYLVQVVEDTRGIIEPLENANYNAQQIQEGAPFTQDFRSVYNSYASMIKNIKAFAVMQFFLFLILNGSLWMMTHWLLEEKIHWKQKPKKAFQFLVKMAVSAAVIFGPFLIFSYYFLLRFIRLSESFNEVVLAIEGLLAVLALFYFFFLLALSAADIPSWKRFLQMFGHLSFKKLWKTFPIFALVMGALFLSSLALYAAINYDKSIILLLGTGIMETGTIVLTRIFWVASIYELGQEHETHNH